MNRKMYQRVYRQLSRVEEPVRSKTLVAKADGLQKGSAGNEGTGSAQGKL